MSHDPVDAVSVWPSALVPLMVGGRALVGGSSVGAGTGVVVVVVLVVVVVVVEPLPWVLVTGVPAVPAA